MRLIAARTAATRIHACSAPWPEKYIAIEEGERALESARVMMGIKYWQEVHRQMSRVKDKLRIHNDASLELGEPLGEQEVAAAQSASAP